MQTIRVPALGWSLLSLALALSAPCWAQTGAASDTTATDSLALTPPAVAPQSTPPDFPRGKISGLAFGDYYYNASGDPRHGYNAADVDTVNPVNIDGSGKPIGKDLNGFQIRRVYFQLDNDLSVRFATRFRLEVDSKSLTSDGKIGLFVKNAWLRAKSVYTRADLYFGLIPTPTFATIEDYWQYRSLEKTVVDFRGLASTSDLGLGLFGFADPDHHVGYNLMVGNGNGQKPETNRDKRFYLAVPLRWRDLRVEPYVDYENVPGLRDRALYRLFAGYEFRKLAIGAEAFRRINHSPTSPNTEPRGYSLYARYGYGGTLAAVARVDLWQPDFRSPNRVDQSMWIGGLDWQPLKDVHVMPNFEAIQYHAKGTGVAPGHHDLQLRLTFYYLFSKPQS